MYNKAQGEAMNHRCLRPRFSSQMVSVSASLLCREMEEAGREKSMAALVFYYYICKMMR